MSDVRQETVTAIMALIRPEPSRLEKPTIAELEKILNSETTDALSINPDGSVSRTPTVTTVGAVADAVMRIIEKESREIVARWMMSRGYATGHGDTAEGMLIELEAQIGEAAREAVE